MSDIKDIQQKEIPQEVSQNLDTKELIESENGQEREDVMPEDVRKKEVVSFVEKTAYFLRAIKKMTRENDVSDTKDISPEDFNFESADDTFDFVKEIDRRIKESIEIFKALEQDVKKLSDDIYQTELVDPLQLKQLIPQLNHLQEMYHAYRATYKKIQQDIRTSQDARVYGENQICEEEGVQDTFDLFSRSSEKKGEAHRYKQTWWGLGKYIHKKKILACQQEADRLDRRQQSLPAANFDSMYVDISDSVRRNVEYVPSSLDRKIKEMYVDELTRREQDLKEVDLSGRLSKEDIRMSIEGAIESPGYRDAIQKFVVDKFLDQVDENLAYYKKEKLSQENRDRIQGIIDRGKYIDRYGFSMDEDENQKRKELSEELEGLPYDVRSQIEELVGLQFSKKLLSVFNLDKNFALAKKYRDACSEAQMVQDTLREGLGEGTDRLEYILQNLQKVDTLKDVDHSVLRAVVQCPAYQQSVGAEVVESQATLYEQELRHRVLTGAPHNYDDLPYAHHMYEYDGPDFAPYNILNAWREPGGSGERPFLSDQYGKNHIPEVANYMMRQSDETLRIVSERNPAIGKIIKLMKEHPDSFHLSTLRVEDKDGQTTFQDNPVAQEINQLVIEASNELLVSEDRENQLFSITTLEYARGRWDSEICKNLEKILEESGDDELKQKIVEAVGSYVLHSRDIQAIRFIIRNVDHFDENQKKHIDSLRPRILAEAFREDIDDSTEQTLLDFLGMSIDKLEKIRSLYKDIFQDERRSSYDSVPSFQQDDLEILLSLLNHEQDLRISVAEIHEWCPDYRPSLYRFRNANDAKVSSVNAYGDIVTLRNREPHIRDGIVAFVEKNGTLPPRVAEAFHTHFVQDIESGNNATTEYIVTQCMVFQKDKTISKSLKDYFTNDHVLYQLLHLTETSFDVYIDFVRKIDKAFNWQEAYSFIDQVRNAQLIDIGNQDDLDIVADFIKEFGVNVSVVLFENYKLLLTEDDVPQALQDLGVTKVGREGINELRRGIRGIRSDLISHDRVPNHSNLLTQEVVSTLVRFETSQWKRGGKRIGDVLAQLDADIESGEIESAPAEYVMGNMYVKKLDEKLVKSFEFSNGFKVRFGQISDSFDLVRRGMDFKSAVSHVKEELLSGIDVELAELEQRVDDTEENPRAKKGIEMKMKQLINLRMSITQAKEDIDVLRALISYDKKDNKLTTAAIRRLSLVYAHDVNPNYSGNIEAVHVDTPTKEGAQHMMTYVGDLLMAEALPKLLLDKKQKKRMKDVFNFNAFREDLTRLEEHAQKGTQEIACIPSRGPLAEFSGYYGDACWTRRDNIVRENPDMVGMTFVTNHGDEVHERIVGSLLLFERSIGGEPCMVLRGMNPRENTINQLNGKSFMEEFLAYIRPIAEERGITKIVAPMNSPGALSNRPAISNAYTEMFAENHTVYLDEPMTFNGYDFEDVVEILDLKK